MSQCHSMKVHEPTYPHARVFNCSAVEAELFYRRGVCCDIGYKILKYSFNKFHLPSPLRLSTNIDMPTPILIKSN